MRLIIYFYGGIAPKLADSRIRLVPNMTKQIGGVCLKTARIDMDDNFYIKFDIDTGTKFLNIKSTISDGIGVYFHQDSKNIESMGFAFDMYKSTEEQHRDFLYEGYVKPHMGCVAINPTIHLKALTPMKYFKPNLEEDKNTTSNAKENNLS